MPEITIITDSVNETPIEEVAEQVAEETTEETGESESWQSEQLAIMSSLNASQQAMRASMEETNRMLVQLVESTQRTNAELTAQIAQLIPPVSPAAEMMPLTDTLSQGVEETGPLEVTELEPERVEENPRPKRRRL